MTESILSALKISHYFQLVHMKLHINIEDNNKWQKCRNFLRFLFAFFMNADFIDCYYWLLFNKQLRCAMALLYFYIDCFMSSFCVFCYWEKKNNIRMPAIYQYIFRNVEQDIWFLQSFYRILFLKKCHLNIWQKEMNTMLMRKRRLIAEWNDYLTKYK